MSFPRSRIIVAGIVTLSAVVACRPVATAAVPSPTVQRFDVLPGTDYTVTLTAASRCDHADGYFLLTSSDPAIDFRVNDPTGAVVAAESTRTTRTNFTFPVSQPGPYILTFDNHTLLYGDQHVTLSYTATGCHQ